MAIYSRVAEVRISLAQASLLVQDALDDLTRGLHPSPGPALAAWEQVIERIEATQAVMTTEQLGELLAPTKAIGRGIAVMLSSTDPERVSELRAKLHLATLLVQSAVDDVERGLHPSPGPALAAWEQVVESIEVTQAAMTPEQLSAALALTKAIGRGIKLVLERLRPPAPEGAA